MSAYSATTSGFGVWKTQAGEAIPIEWMQTQHLCHAFNMVCRNNKLVRDKAQDRLARTGIVDGFTLLHGELVARDSLVWTTLPSVATAVVQISPHRETAVQLCMLRTLLDMGLGIGIFRHNMDAYLAGFQSNPHEWSPKTIAKFTEYRLDYPK